MALRDQPYLPLYIKDFTTDEKLAQCSAEATGVYIRLMCLLHKSEQYGTILLRQKFKQTNNKEKNFAIQIAKHLPFDLIVIERAIIELLEEGVIKITGNLLSQKRMVKDADISDKRSTAGRKGANSTHQIDENFAVANQLANSAIENEIENASEFKDSLGVKGEKKGFNTMPLATDFNGLPEQYITQAIELVRLISNSDITKETVITFWDIFKTQELTGGTHYHNEGKVYSHFLNVIKKQKFTNGTANRSGIVENKFTSGADKLLAKGKTVFANTTGKPGD